MKNNLNIVELIEKNPITRLSKDYQNDLINKIKDRFTGKEQQLFASSFFGYLNYDSKKDFIIDLDDVWKWIGFSKKGHAKTLLEKYFIEDIDYKILLPQSRKQDLDLDKKNNKKEINVKDIKIKKNQNEYKDHGGNNKEQILMTINTFKKFCLKANTKKADEIHDYYIKLEELLHETINEETDDLRNQLEIKNIQIQKKDKKTIELQNQLQNKDAQLQNKDKQIENDKKKYKLEMKIKKHEILIETLKNKKCVYVGEIKENNFIKIGSSKDIDSRGQSLKRTYGKYIFLEAFECSDFRDVEKNILEHPDILKNLYKEKINGHSSTEVVKLSEDFNYNQLLAIVNNCISESKSYTFTPEQLLKKQELDLERQKLDNQVLLETHKLDNDLLLNLSNNKLYEEIIKEKLMSLFENLKKPNIENNEIKNNDMEQIEIEQKIEEKNEDPDSDMDVNKIKLKKMNNVQKIQQVDPNNLKKVIKVYNGMACVIRDPENKGFQKTSIRSAIQNNYLYKGFRWSYVKRNKNENVCNLEPTVERQNKKEISTIVQLNSSKTKIIDTFGTKSIITKKLKIGMPKMNSIIENCEKYNGCYYVELDKCSQNLLDNYDKPINKFAAGKAKQIKQINPKTKQIVIFNSLSDIYRKYGIADSTIVNAIKNKEIYQGFLWEYK